MRTPRTALVAHAPPAAGALPTGCASPEPVSDSTPGDAFGTVYAEGERPAAQEPTP
ncbi:hypothetical protein [Streptomyces corynorhini]|uniref:hypothetical protein n=1 Tax=Streptomyces corynorhini TaxID=2282652 RepID=UPI001313EA7F|nr:hypothetical protein [Streptomyces corynorhini]